MGNCHPIADYTIRGTSNSDLKERRIGNADLFIVNSTGFKKAGKESRVHTERRCLHPRSMLHALGSFTSHFKSTTCPPLMGVSSACSGRTTHSGLASTIFITQVPGVSVGEERGSYFNKDSFGYLCVLSTGRAGWGTCSIILQVIHYTCVLLN
jgi:hypothetical protein